MPYYAVANGRENGVYDSWSDCKDQVNGYSGASFKKFDTAAEASSFASGGGSSYSGGGSSYSGSSYFNSGTSRSQPQTQDIYIDGASRGNGKTQTPNAGYGLYYGENDSRNVAVAMDQVRGGNVTATNQRAELAAARHALQNIHDEPKDTKYTIKTDSQYTKEATTNWSKNWENNGWKTSNNTDVANRDIIEDNVKLCKSINQDYEKKGWGSLQFEHVRGHQGNHGNEMADALANKGADKMAKSRRRRS
ncbi:ribonuclease H1 [[Candida] anglica]